MARSERHDWFKDTIRSNFMLTCTPHSSLSAQALVWGFVLNLQNQLLSFSKLEVAVFAIGLTHRLFLKPSLMLGNLSSLFSFSMTKSAWLCTGRAKKSWVLHPCQCAVAEFWSASISLVRAAFNEAESLVSFASSSSCMRGIWSLDGDCTNQVSICESHFAI